MIKLNTFVLIILLSLFGCLVSGCGQKGALRHGSKNSLEINQALTKQEAKQETEKLENSNPKLLEEEPATDKETDQ